MKDLFSEIIDMFDSLGMYSTPVYTADSKKCPVCGYTLSDFKRNGKFGCGECYRTFEKSAEQILRQIHSGSRHSGKIPSKSGAEVKAKRRLEELKRKLKEAVNNEDYETAARLHAEIKTIEGGGIK